LRKQVTDQLPLLEKLGGHLYLKKTGSSDREISFQIQTPKLPKETALISGQERTHDFPGIPSTSRGRFYACILC
jgi:hypothetical protein